MKSKRIFITGTDTDVGKTLITATLVHCLQEQEKRVVALKPVAAGCEWLDGQLCNSDALTLISVMQSKQAYNKVNPIALKAPLAPHISAAQESKTLSVEQIQQACQLSQHDAEYLLIEGAGGWLVPLNNQETYADYVQSEKLDVIMVVGMKLGCINHALLTQASILAMGLNLIGWVANIIDPHMAAKTENISTLKNALKAPCLGEIPWIEGENIIQQASKYVNISALL